MKVLRDTWLVFGRYFGLFIHNPVWVAFGVLQPLLYLVLFAPLLKSIATMRGFPPGGAYNVFVPGLLVQLGLFGASGVGFSLIAELRAGVIERLRVTPVSRVAMLLGRALRDMVAIAIQSLILILISLPFGLSIHPALAVRSEDGYAPIVFTATLPILLLSGVLLPMSIAPQWLQNVAAINPLLYAVDAARHIFLGNLGDPSVAKGVVILAVLSVVGVGIGARQFGRAVA